MRRVLALLVALAMVMSVFTGVFTPVPSAVAVPGVTTWYVAKTGLDTNDGTLALPFLTIQKAIDTAAEGDTINVGAGTYSEGNLSRDIYTGAAGGYATGLLVYKNGLTIQGVDGSGAPITSRTGVLATVIATQRDASLGDTIITGDNVTLSGLRFQLANLPIDYNKNVFATGENFTLKDSVVDNLATGCSALYLSDERGDMHVNTFTIEDNQFLYGEITVINGVGESGPASGRKITGNLIEHVTDWGGISLTGITGAGWTTQSIGDVTITGNTFADNAYQIIARGSDYANPTGYWTGFLASNTFDKAVLTLTPGGDARPDDYERLGWVNNLTDSANKVYLRMIGTDIQEAIDRADPGDTINVAAGDYGITSQIDISKGISIIGDPTNKPVVKALNNINTSPGTGYYLFRAGESVTASVNISNIVLDGNGFYVYGGMRFYPNNVGTIENCVFHDLKDVPPPTSYDGWGIVNYGSMTIDHNEFTEIGRVGIYIGGPNNTVTHNTYTGKGPGDWLDYGIQVGCESYNGTATIEHNTITDCEGIARTDASVSAGINVWHTGSVATVANNTITGNYYGIAVYTRGGAETPSAHAHNNDVSGNTTLGAWRDSDHGEFDATNNWWGDATGPHHDTSNPSGTGNAVSDNVVYAPWYDSAAMTNLLSGDLVVPLGTTLEIPAGMDLTVNGTTIVRGTFTVHDSHDTLTITDDFTVESGTTTWDNSHVKVANASKSVTIRVKSGGTLIISNGTLVEKDTTLSGALNYYFVVEDGATLTMTDSSLKDCGVSGIGAQAGLYIDTSTVTLQHNTLSGNYVGLVIGPNAAGVEVHDNTISGNTAYEVYNNRTTILNAEYNWWGSVNGPVPAKIGSLVDYTPWSMSAGDHAGFTAALSLVPSSGTVRYANGDTFDLTVRFDVSGVNVNALDARITYDTDHLTVTEVAWSPSHPFAQEVELNHATPGVVVLAAGQASDLDGPFASSGDVAVIHFTTVGATTPDTTAVSFDLANTFVTKPNTDDIDHPLNVLTAAAGSTITVQDILVDARGANATYSTPNPQTVVYDGTAVFTVTPAAGYYLDTVSRGTFTYDGNTSTYTWTIPNVTASVIVTATLSPLNDVYVAKTGDDTLNDGHDPLYPVLTIGRGITLVMTGGHVHVALGQYDEHLTIGKKLSLLGADKTTTFIDGTGTGVVVTITASEVVLKNFTVRNSGTNIAAHGGVVLAYANGCTIENNVITDNASGIGLLSSSLNYLTDNTINNSARYGVVMDFYPGNTTNASLTNTLHGNEITHSGRDGIYVGKDSDHNTIEDSFISETAGTTEGTNFEGNGIYFWKSSGNTVTNSHIFDNTVGHGIEMMGSSDNVITGNAITGNKNGLMVRHSDSYANSPNTISGNTISGNADYGVFTDYTELDGVVLVATYNWWGAESGPLDDKALPNTPDYNNVSGAGNKVSPFVDYKPFWMNEVMDKDSTITVVVAIANGVHDKSIPVTVQFGDTLSLTANPDVYYYVYSTTRGGVTTTLAFHDRMLGLDQVLSFANITATLADDRTTGVAINIFRRGDITSNGVLAPDTHVDGYDAGILIQQWRYTTTTWHEFNDTVDLLADLNCDDVVNVYDLSMMMSLWH